MPLQDTYTVTATLKISVESAHAKGEVVSYEVTRMHTGPSARGGVTPPAELFPKVVEDAVVKAVSAEKALRAGAANAEARRLK